MRKFRYVALAGLLIPQLYFFHASTRVSKHSAFSTETQGVVLVNAADENTKLNEVLNINQANIFLNSTNANKNIELLNSRLRTYLLQPFSQNISTQPINSRIPAITRFNNADFSLFKFADDNNITTVSYSADQNSLNFFSPSEVIAVNNQPVKLPPQLLGTLPDINLNDLVGVNKLTIAPGNMFNPAFQLKYLNNFTASRLQLSENNLLDSTKSSFESDNNAQPPGDCSQALPGNPDIAVGTSNDATDGATALKISAANHFGCTERTFPVTLQPGRRYLFSFDFKNLEGNKAGYYFKLRDTKNQGYSNFEMLETSRHDWSSFSTVIDTDSLLQNKVSADVDYRTPKPQLPDDIFRGSETGRPLEDIKFLDVYFYAPSDGTSKITNLYDHLQLREYTDALIPPIKFNTLIKNGSSLLVADKLRLASKVNTVEYTPDNNNLLADKNASFENGLWQREAADCSDQEPGKPDLALKLSQRATHGTNSAQISSRNHNACIYKSFQVKLSPGKQYKLSLDYRNLAGQKARYFYDLRGQAKQSARTRNLETKDNNWHTAEEIIDPGSEIVETLDVYLYAPSDGSMPVTNEYDNIRLQEWAPKDLSSYYLRADQPVNSLSDIKTDFKPVNKWKSQVALRGLSDSVLMLYPQKYSGGLAVYPNKFISKPQLINGWFYETWFRQSVAKEAHFQINNYSNAWWIDVKELCRVQNICHKNPDGTFDLSLIVEHKNNQLMYASLLVTFIIMSGLFIVLPIVKSIINKRYAKWYL